MRQKLLLGLFLASLLILIVFQLTKPKVDSNKTIFISLDEALLVPEQVKVLGLQGQNLEFLSPLIKNFPHLEVLDVSRNAITEIPDEIWQIPSLRHLDVSNNQIAHLDLAAKVKLVNFNVPDILNFNDNKFTVFNIDSEAFAKVRDLRVARNQLQAFRIVGDNDISSLERLDLSGNRLQTLDRLSALASLIELNLSENRLDEIQSDKPLMILETVSLRLNNLKTWPETILRSAVLTSVDLSGNEIEKLPETIQIPETLKHLHLALNNIHPADLRQHQNIMRLSETVCPDRDRQKPYLVKTIFSRMSANFDQVTELNLSGLALATVPAELQFLRNLKRLDLSRNKLNALPSWFDQMQTLEKIDLTENQFDAKPEILSRLSRLKSIEWDGDEVRPDGTAD